MEITFDTILSLLGLFIGGGGGAFFTWRYMRRKAKAEAQTEEVNMAKAVQDTYQQMLADKGVEIEDKNRIIQELRQDRDHFRQDRNELRERLEKMERKQDEQQREITRALALAESMRPFVCTLLGCKNRVRGIITDEPETPQVKEDIEPINHNEL